MKKTRIYLVDDHQMIIDGIKGMFRNDEEFEFVGSQNDGLLAKNEIIQMQSSIDLAILDVNISGISGIELCAILKAEIPGIRVLLISMYQNSSVITEALQADANGYLLKTSGYAEFKEAIKRVLDDHYYYSESIYPIIYKEYQNEKRKDQLIQMLTKRELDVLKLIVKELTSADIADELCISKKTVDIHRQNLLLKTQSKSTIGLVKYAIRAGIQMD